MRKEIRQYRVRGTQIRGYTVMSPWGVVVGDIKVARGSKRTTYRALPTRGRPSRIFEAKWQAKSYLVLTYIGLPAVDARREAIDG